MKDYRFTAVLMSALLIGSVYGLPLAVIGIICGAMLVRSSKSPRQSE